MDVTPILAPNGIAARQVVCVGLGDREQIDVGVTFRAFAAAAKQLSSKRRPRVVFCPDPQWSAEMIESAVAGIDSRFAFVIPVYGGGYIHQHKMTAKQFREYNAKWDPAAHLPYAKMPMLWVNGFNEPVFPLDLFCRSAGTAAGPSILCIRPFLIHGHGFGWEEVWEIDGFANGVVNGGKPIPTLGKPRVNRRDGLVHAKFTGELKSAVLGYTTADKWKNGA